jgi:hypothetical protein
MISLHWNGYEISIDGPPARASDSRVRSPDLLPYNFSSWTTDDGLPQNSVYAILQTRDGYLWFTTLDGLVRFDG